MSVNAYTSLTAMERLYVKALCSNQRASEIHQDQLVLDSENCQQRGKEYCTHRELESLLVLNSKEGVEIIFPF